MWADASAARVLFRLIIFVLLNQTSVLVLASGKCKTPRVLQQGETLSKLDATCGCAGKTPDETYSQALEICSDNLNQVRTRNYNPDCAKIENFNGESTKTCCDTIQAGITLTLPAECVIDSNKKKEFWLPIVLPVVLTAVFACLGFLFKQLVWDKGLIQRWWRLCRSGAPKHSVLMGVIKGINESPPPVNRFV
jgi:hypothetical protein